MQGKNPNPLMQAVFNDLHSIFGKPAEHKEQVLVPFFNVVAEKDGAVYGRNLKLKAADELISALAAIKIVATLELSRLEAKE